jgi:hypothetical protein
VSFSDGVLTVTSKAGVSADIHLTGSFDPAGFHLLQDYDSGTIGEDQLGIDPPGDDQAMVVYTPLTVPNVPPTVAVPGALSVQMGVKTLLSGISISDSDAYALDEGLTVTVTDKLGALSSTAEGGNEVKVSGTKKMTLSGTLDQVNHYLTTINYLASNAGVDTVTITASDSNGGVGSASYSITAGAAANMAAMMASWGASLGAPTGALGSGGPAPLSQALSLAPNPA